MPDPEQPDVDAALAHLPAHPEGMAPGDAPYLHRHPGAGLHEHPYDAIGHVLAPAHEVGDDGLPLPPREHHGLTPYEQRAVLAGWTRHGHPIPDVPQHARYKPAAVARCGGVGMCGKCQEDAATAKRLGLHHVSVHAEPTPGGLDDDLPALLAHLEREHGTVVAPSAAPAEHQRMHAGGAALHQHVGLADLEAAGFTGLREAVAETHEGLARGALLRQLHEVAEHLREQETAVVQEAHARGLSPTEMRDTTGGYILAPVLVARAHALAALAHLRG